MPLTATRRCAGRSTTRGEPDRRSDDRHAREPARWPAPPLPARPPEARGSARPPCARARRAAGRTTSATPVASPRRWPRPSASSPIPTTGPARRSWRRASGRPTACGRPLQVAVRKGFEKGSRGASTSELLVARRPAAARAGARGALVRDHDPPADAAGRSRSERGSCSAGPRADADDWITVDTLAHPFGKGILAEAYRWAELEQLTVSPSRWERRLVGSTIATMPFVEPHRRAVSRRSSSTALAAPRHPDRRRRAGRPEGPVVGLPIDGRRRPAATTAALRARGEHRRAGGRRPPRLGRPRQPVQARARPSAAAICATARGDPPPPRRRRRPREAAELATRFAEHGPRPADARAAAGLTRSHDEEPAP